MNVSGASSNSSSPAGKIPRQVKVLLTASFFSAFATVGFDVGVTGQLSHFGQFVLVVGMFVGRLGILLLLSAIWEVLNRGKFKHQNRIGYPREDLYV